ncbi:NHL repeat-containing protein [Massilia endophytica]|uniref:NHL repeat-containing protein n=1 Tax=Massilia endophytica TaxID=2899220 RepID=UPI001E5B44C9|nr:NHL repeat-containing protein [Massilia endophytica]UGQ48349.1 gluconolaconase [Massilia endophytica]
MKRKLTIAALAAAGLLGASAWYFMSQQTGLPGRSPLAVIQRAVGKTPAYWTARTTTVSGDGVQGVADGPAAQARWSDPYGIVADAKGTIYVADGGDANRIRKITTQGEVLTLAGGKEGFADGQGAAASFNTPSGLAIDRQGNLYVADTANHAIRKVTPEGAVATLAGNGQPGYADGQGAEARFNGPVGIAVDGKGNVFVADTYNDCIRMIDAQGMVTTYAGNGKPGDADGPAKSAQLDTPTALAVAADGSLYIADTFNDKIRKVDSAGMLSTVAAPPEAERRPKLRRPTALALTRDGHLYISTGSGGRILHMTPDGQYHPLEDADRPPGVGSDGTVQLFAPRGLALQEDGSLLASDGMAFRLHRLAPPRKGEAAPAQASIAPIPQRKAPMLWPVKPQDAPHEVVGLMGEVRGSFDGENRDHFHAGLDVQAPVGDTVLAVEATKVTDPLPNWGFGTLSEGISIGNMSYIHMRVGRAGRDKPLGSQFQLLRGEKNKSYRVRVQRGARFEVGDALGTINGMAHVHLDYFPAGGVINPLKLPFIGLRDTIAPTVRSVVLFDAQGKRLPGKRGQPVHVPRALQEVSIVADIFDQMDDNLARRRLGIYRLGYQLLKEDGKPAPGFEQPVITQVYDRLPRNREAVKLVYAPSSGITVYGSKSTQFAYAVNNTLEGGQALPGMWNIGGIEPGAYTLRIFAADFAGNVATQGRDLPIVIE